MRNLRLLTILAAAAFVGCQPAEETPEAGQAEAGAEGGEMAPTAAPTGQEDPVASARSAAPASVSADAAVVDMEGEVLAEGSGPYTCLPDDPEVPGNSPMCLDEPWMNLIQAWMNREEPTYDRVGIGYMLEGDMPLSNTDPFAEGPTPDNQWMEDAGPHIMVAVPDQSELEGLPTDPSGDAPWVMWKGTPYAHIMVPMPGQR